MKDQERGLLLSICLYTGVVVLACIVAIVSAIHQSGWVIAGAALVLAFAARRTNSAVQKLVAFQRIERLKSTELNAGQPEINRREPSVSGGNPAMARQLKARLWTYAVFLVLIVGLVITSLIKGQFAFAAVEGAAGIYVLLRAISTRKKLNGSN